jgi:prohibitin 2
MNKLLLILPLFLLASCGEVIDAGNRGVEVRFGKVVGEPLKEGLYYYNPFTSNIIEFDVKTQKWETKATAYTKDVQQAKFDIVVNYRPNPDKIGDIYQSLGLDYVDKILPQVVQGSLKNVIGKWDAVELISNRDKATTQVESTVKAALLNKNIEVSNIEITGIDFASEFEKAVEAKVVAVQRAAEAENKTKQIQEEAKQKVIAAKAEAESMKIRSEALAQNKSLVEYEAVQKWDGKLPQYMLSSGSIPFININK